MGGVKGEGWPLAHSRDGLAAGYPGAGAGNCANLGGAKEHAWVADNATPGHRRHVSLR